MHTADLLSSPFIYNVFKTAKSPFGMFSEAVKWLQKSRVSLAIMCTSRSEAQRQVMPKKKKRGGGHKWEDVYGHTGGRGSYDIMTEMQITRHTHPCRSWGAFSRHQATLIAFSVKGNRQLASGPLSEMIQNNSTCQEAHAHPLKFKAV